MMNYDLTPYLDGNDPTVWCHVRWTPRDGESRCCWGDFLDCVGGVAQLRCGIYFALEPLGFPEDMLEDDAYAVRISDLVDRQLRLFPEAVLRCPDGELEICLCEPPPEHGVPASGVRPR